MFTGGRHALPVFIDRLLAAAVLRKMRLQRRMRDDINRCRAGQLHRCLKRS